MEGTSIDPFKQHVSIVDVSILTVFLLLTCTRDFLRQKEAAAASRKDSKLKAVVISEAWDKKSSKYNSPSLPFPFDCKATYEQSMRTPMGREYNTTAAHR